VGASPGVALGIALGNTAEAVVGAALLRRSGAPPGDSLPWVLRLVGFAALFSTTIAASGGTLCLVLGGVVEATAAFETWRAWWLGDALGALVVAPLLVTWATVRRLPSGWRVAEAAGGAALIALGSLAVFGTQHASAGPLEQPYVLVPMVMVAALRFELLGATAASFVMSVVAVWGTAHGLGPFVKPTLSRSLLELQAFMGVVTMAGLLLGATLKDRSSVLRRRQEFLAMASHDLKTPLQVIKICASAASTALSRMAGVERVVAQVARIQRAGDRMTSLVRDLLDWAALDGGPFVLKLAPEDARDLTTQAIDAVRPLAEERSQSVKATFSEGPLVVRCDRDRTFQVLTNLMENAIKFTPDGAAIAVGVARTPTGIRFSVSDTGPGIGSAHMQDIFEPFWTGPETTAPGTGLGLSIAKSIVETHGGKIWATTGAGVGSVFSFELPHGGEASGVDPDAGPR